MNDERDIGQIEELLRQAAVDLRDAYPPTPPIAASVRRLLSRRRFAPVVQQRVRVIVRAVALATAAFVVVLLISPDAREAVARFFGLETVRIERLATPIPTATTQPDAQPALDLAGQTTLADARARSRFEVRLPGYPPDIGLPQRVYVQEFGREYNHAQQVILVYANFAVFEARGIVYQKSIDSGTVVEEVTVDGRDALWLSGAVHMIQVRDASGQVSVDFVRFVGGNVLAWEAGGVTYRIETKLTLEEALKIAESIR